MGAYRRGGGRIGERARGGEKWEFRAEEVQPALQIEIFRCTKFPLKNLDILLAARGRMHAHGAYAPLFFPKFRSGKV